jgi:hypothetical protein
MVWFFLLEFGFVPVFYLMGYHGMSKLSWISLAIFAVGGMSFQYFTVTSPRFQHAFRKEIEFDDNVHKNVYFAQQGQVAQTIMGFQVRNLHIWLVSSVPCCINIMSTAFSFGTGERRWGADVQATWQRRWAAFGNGPAVIGDIYGPHVLQLSLVILFLMRAACLHADDGHTRADAANLLLIEKVLLRGGELGESRHRHMFLTLKIVMLWMKVSMLAMLYDRLSNSEFLSMILAILLCFKALVPLTARALAVFRARDPCCMAVCCPIQLLIFIVALHFVGVYWCSSHDWALLHGGCTTFFSINDTTTK